MKTIKLFILLIFTSAVFAQNNGWDKRLAFNYFEIIGKCIANERELPNTTVYVYEKDSLIYSFKTPYKKDFSIKLPLNTEITIVFEKKGFVNKKIFVDTHTKYPEDNYKPIALDIEMLPFKKNVDYSALDNPVTIIKYNLDTYSFEFDNEYSIKMLDEQNKIVHQMYVSK
jgi:hypothetical protein